MQAGFRFRVVAFDKARKLLIPVTTNFNDTRGNGILTSGSIQTASQYGERCMSGRSIDELLENLHSLEAEVESAIENRLERKATGVSVSDRPAQGAL